jgi:hypothetical protein
MDQCCGGAGTHDELKQYYSKPATFTPQRKGRPFNKSLQSSMSKEQQDNPPFDEH